MPVSQPRRAAEDLAAPTLRARGARWLSLGAATVGAVLLLQAASLPTPWLFGSLLVGVAYALGAAGTALRTPVLAGQISQAIVGVAFGFQMQASTLQAVVSSWLGVSFVVLGTLAVSLAAGIVVARLTGISQATAALGLVAGGAPGVVAMAEELRADARLVAFVQYLRVVVVLVAPLAAYAQLHRNAAGQAIPAPASERLAADLGLTAVSLLGGLLLARVARISAGTLMGPLLVAGALSASGLVGHTAVPEVLQDVAFAVIGLQVGLRFTIATIREAGRLLVWALASILAIVAVCAALAVVLVPLADVTYADAYLATTPAGLYSVLAASIGIGANTTFVDSVQILRVFVMILAAPPLVRLLTRRVDACRAVRVTACIGTVASTPEADGPSSRKTSPALREAAALTRLDPVATPTRPKGVEMSRTRKSVLAFALVALVAAAAAGATAATGKRPSAKAGPPVKVQVLAPRPGDVVGKQSKGFFVDLAIRYPSLASSGADFQLTGPGTHQNLAPFPGAFAAGVDEKLPGLIVLLSTSTVGARNAQNLANLFNLTGFTNQKTNEIWDTWLVGAPVFGKNVRSVLRVAVAADKNKDGIYNDAPATVPDANHDGRINAVDLKAFGVASEIAVVPFRISD